jgi:hypothetical protein
MELVGAGWKWRGQERKDRLDYDKKKPNELKQIITYKFFLLMLCERFKNL